MSGYGCWCVDKCALTRRHVRFYCQPSHTRLCDRAISDWRPHVCKGCDSYPEAKLEAPHMATIAAIDLPLQGAQSAASIVSCTRVSTHLYSLILSPEQTHTFTPVLISSPPIYPSFSRHVFQEAP